MSDTKEASPEQSMDTNSAQAGTHRGRRFSRMAGIILGIIILSFGAGAFGSYVIVSSGLLDATKTITNNRDKIVLQQGEVVADVAKNVSPSVVSITTQSTSASARFFGGNTVVEGAGSGIIISKDGYVLTNKHVVPDSTTSVTVITADGTEYKDVSVVGRDLVNDAAFLKVPNVNDLSPATIGNSKAVTVGQQVVAVGNALGQYQNTVTSGIISGIGRPVQAGSESGDSLESLDNLFQTDAAINPGNSGGPLLNLAGEVIGVNTAVAQDAQGIGFAIPIDDIKGLITSILTKGKLARGVLGVRYVTIDAQVANHYHLSLKRGAYVIGDNTDPAVIPGGAAERAGVKAKDIITAVNDQQISPGQSLAGLLGQYGPGDTVKLSITRGNNQLTLNVALQPAS